MSAHARAGRTRGSATPGRVGADGPAPRAPIPAIAWPALAAVLAAAAWLHRDALHAPFFADDYAFLDTVGGRSLGAALSAPDPLGNYFRPVGRPL
ncbi:MAG TPA: hypothetical protein VLV15_12500, partial [Dongiaceae bacterium]|nr:hypothetical protein [Dongiaceae bacterium]